MSKELEALKCLEELANHRIEYKEGFEHGFTKTIPFKSTMEYKNIKQALQRLEAIDNANPSEALEYLKSLDIQVRFMGILDVPSWEKYLPTIKQSLTTKSKKEQAWEICIKKHISIWRFRNIVFGYEQKQNGNFVNDTYEYYKNHFGYYHEGFEFELLTEDEFELLKSVFEKNIQK